MDLRGRLSNPPEKVKNLLDVLGKKPKKRRRND
jgi:hypothetical protein